MKSTIKIFSRSILVAIGFAFAVSSPVKANPAKVGSGEMARLIVNRESNFGFYEWVNLFVDGTQVGVVGYGSGYDAALTPGKHVLSITTTPQARSDPCR
jgi:hypothetical protein